MIIEKTPAFDRKFKKLTSKQQQDFFDAILIFQKDPHAQGLKTHKLQGKWKDFWAFRVNYSDRCIFLYTKENTVLLYDIGSHRVYES